MNIQEIKHTMYAAGYFCKVNEETQRIEVSTSEAAWFAEDMLDSVNDDNFSVEVTA